MTTNNYIKVTIANGVGLDTLGLFPFDDNDAEQRTNAVQAACAVQRDAGSRARLGIWRRHALLPFDVIGEMPKAVRS